MARYAEMNEQRQGLSFSSERDEDGAILRVSGEVDISSADALEQRLAQLREAGTKNITVDLSGVPFMDSSGLRVLLKMNAELISEGGHLRIAEPSTAVARLLEVSGLEDHFERDQ